MFTKRGILLYLIPVLLLIVGCFMTLFGSKSSASMDEGGAAVAGFGAAGSLCWAYSYLKGDEMEPLEYLVFVIIGCILSIVEYFNNELIISEKLQDEDLFKNTVVGQLREWADDAKPASAIANHVMDYFNPGRFWGITLLIVSFILLKFTLSMKDNRDITGARPAFFLFIIVSVLFAPYMKLNSFWSLNTLAAVAGNFVILLIYVGIVWKFQHALPDWP